LRCWGTTGLHDSSLEGSGFEISVPRYPRWSRVSEMRDQGRAPPAPLLGISLGMPAPRCAMGGFQSDIVVGCAHCEAPRGRRLATANIGQTGMSTAGRRARAAARTRDGVFKVARLRQYRWRRWEERHAFAR